MMDLLRIAASAVFGWKWVCLVDSDGEVVVRRVRWMGDAPYAERIGFNIHPVRLLDEGKVQKHYGEYVDAWRPYDPRQPKELPHWSAA